MVGAELLLPLREHGVDIDDTGRRRAVYDAAPENERDKGMQKTRKMVSVGLVP